MKPAALSRASRAGAAANALARARALVLPAAGVAPARLLAWLPATARPDAELLQRLTACARGADRGLYAVRRWLAATRPSLVQALRAQAPASVLGAAVLDDERRDALLLWAGLLALQPCLRAAVTRVARQRLRDTLGAAAYSAAQASLATDADALLRLASADVAPIAGDVIPHRAAVHAAGAAVLMRALPQLESRALWRVLRLRLPPVPYATARRWHVDADALQRAYIDHAAAAAAPGLATATTWTAAAASNAPPRPVPSDELQAA